jgi:hypothetical protein
MIKLEIKDRTQNKTKISSLLRVGMVLLGKNISF